MGQVMTKSNDSHESRCPYNYDTPSSAPKSGSDINPDNNVI